MLDVTQLDLLNFFWQTYDQLEDEDDQLEDEDDQLEHMFQKFFLSFGGNPHLNMFMISLYCTDVNMYMDIFF